MGKVTWLKQVGMGFGRKGCRGNVLGRSMNVGSLSVEGMEAVRYKMDVV